MFCVVYFINLGRYLGYLFWQILGLYCVLKQYNPRGGSVQFSVSVEQTEKFSYCIIGQGYFLIHFNSSEVCAVNV
jgi:hypothetical protein